MDRVVQFSDAVVAIAITLLVLPLTEIEGTDYAGSVVDLLSDNSATLWAFAISFAVISIFWLTHHRIFGRLKAVDSTIVVVNLLWLACIVFLPFPTSLVQEDASSAFTTFYLAWLLLTSLVTRWLAVVIERRPALWSEPPNAASREGSIRGWLTVAGFAFAVVVSLASPRYGLYALLLLALVDPVARLLTRHR
jgi:uncharacterized membrane protein